MRRMLPFAMILIAFTAYHAYFASYAQAAKPGVTRVAVKGRDAFVLVAGAEGGGVLSQGGAPDLRLSPTAPEVRDAADTVVAAFRRGPGLLSGTLIGRDGKPAWLITSDKERDEVLATADGGARVVRVKMKDGSFNVYDGATRIGKGKPRDGHIEIRAPDSKDLVNVIDGESGTWPAMMLSLPVAPPYRALLWRAARAR